MDVKKCSKCGIEKSFEEFYTYKSGLRIGKYSASCKACSRAKCIEYNSSHKEEIAFNGAAYTAENWLRNNSYLEIYGQLEFDGDQICTVCGETKHCTEFYKHLSQKLGYRQDCKSCCRLRDRGRNKKKLDKLEFIV